MLVSSAGNTLFSLTHFCPHAPTKQLCPSATIIVLFTAQLTLSYAQHNFFVWGLTFMKTWRGGNLPPASSFGESASIGQSGAPDFLLIVRCQPEHFSENAQD